MKKIAWLLVLYSFASRAYDCAPKKLEQGLMSQSKCVIDKYSNMASTFFGNVLGFKSFFKSCSGADSAVGSQKMQYVSDSESKKCKRIETYFLSSMDYLNLREPKCEDTIRVLFLKSLGSPANSLSVKNFSEHCLPKEVQVTTYCCP